MSPNAAGTARRHAVPCRSPPRSVAAGLAGMTGSALALRLALCFVIVLPTLLGVRCGAETPGAGPGRAEGLDAIVAPVDDEDGIPLANRDAGRLVELPGSAARAAEGGHELPVGR